RIDWELDDLGLDPFTFRVYARLARRAGTNKGAFESVAEMAKGCRMSDRKVHDALQILVRLNLVEKQEHKSKPSTYYLNDKSEWLTSAPHAEVPAPAPAPNADPPLHDVQTTSAPRADKVVQVTQAKGSLKSPPTPGEAGAPVAQARHSIDYQEFIDVYNENRGPLPSVDKATKKRQRGIAALVKEHGYHESLALLVDATKFVANEEWWVKRAYNLDNLLVDGRVVEDR